MSEDNERISIQDATDLIHRALTASGVTDTAALSCANALVAAEAEGQVGHGFSRLSDYAAQVKTGKVDGRAVPVVSRPAPGTIAVDAGHGLAYPALDAAIEAGIEGIPAIGFSLCDYSWDANFEPALGNIKKIVSEALTNGIPKGIVLNVNIPKTETAPKGVKICRQARGNWKEKFDKRTSPSGKDYYWLTGKFELLDKGEDTDEWALEHGYISVVPTQFDLTAHHAIPQINNWNLHEQ